MAKLDEAMGMLNDAQREAVDRVDGPLLVVAGPGTGKTQLLGLRAANILATRDVEPQNILCLTFSDAGAEAMRKRLVALIGREAYGIEVSTFHAFASAIKSRHPEHFKRSPTAAVASDLHSKEIIDGLLKGLPVGSPLSGIRFPEGVASGIGSAASFISRLKRFGLSPDDYRAIMRQNIECADYLDADEELIALVNSAIGEGFDGKEEYVGKFEELIHAAAACAPEELVKPIISTPGIYEPYLTWLDGLVSRTELICGNKTKGYRDIRDSQFMKGKDGIRRASIRAASEKGLIACDVYEHYRRKLGEEGLIDYDDMIMDCIAAIEGSDALRHELQDRYRYIQVDEFQDTNGSQMRIVELLCEGIESPNVMAVGDDDQAIMRFQGASVAYIEQFRERFCPHSVVLDVNYRSTPEIVTLGSTVSDQIERRLAASVGGKAIRAKRGPGEQTEFHETVFPSQELEYQALARDIRKRIDCGFVDSCANPDEAIAVIARKNASITALIPYLIRENVPFAFKLKTSVEKMETMQTLLALLRFVDAYSKGREGRAESLLPQIIAAPELNGEHEGSVRFALEAARNHRGRWMQALRESENPRLKELYGDLMEWSAAAPAAPVRELIFRIAKRPLRHYASLRESDPYAFAEFNSGIRALIRFAESELGTAAKLGRTLRLRDIIERLDQAERFDAAPDAAIELGTPGAVRLTTAHSAKGLEFDLVYLLDADQHTWHFDRNSSSIFAPNMLIGDEKDGDDHRRLLFVAVTRAKDCLELYRAGGEMLAEFLGDAGSDDAIGSIEGEFDAEDLGEAIETDWRQSYVFDTPELWALLEDSLPPRRLSASMLNAFVAYEDGNPASLRFPAERVLGLPQTPLISFDFGSIVHAYLEDYLNRVVKAEDVAAAEALAADRLDQVRLMDYREEDKASYIKRFGRIVGSAGPWIESRLSGRIETEAVLDTVTPDGIPIFGKCDLLLIDDESKTVRVVDYKTGISDAAGKPDPAYARQLCFYRLLVESTPRFSGYRVTACEDWYVEPDKKTGEMREPVVVSVSDEDLARLNDLVNTVWRRLCDADFDTTAFEESSLKAEALAKKGNRKQNLQHAYEQWLIEQEA